MSKRAIIIVYDGFEPSADILAALVAVLGRTSHIDPEKVETYVLDEQAITEAFIAKAMPVPELKPNVAELKTLVDTAAETIGETFKNELSQGVAEFVSALSTTCTLTCLSHDTGPVLIATKTLATSDVPISQSIARKYKITAVMREAIKTVYRSLCAGHIAQL